MEEKTYRIKNTTHRDYEPSDNKEQEALISVMRDLATPFGFMVLTYGLRSGNLSSLVTTLHHGNLLTQLQDTTHEVSSDDESKLLEQLLPLYSKAQLRKLQTNLAALRKRGEDTIPFLKQYTKNIGDPVKFSKAINEAFTCWIQKNRPHIYKEFEDEICHPLVTHEVITDTIGLQDAAAAMDQEAVLHDEADAPKKYWCGYADALRGDTQALKGLRELIGDSATGVKEARKLGYNAWLEHIDFSTTAPEPEPPVDVNTSDSGPQEQPNIQTQSKDPDSKEPSQVEPREPGHAESTQPITPPPEPLIPAPLLDDPAMESPQLFPLESSLSEIDAADTSQHRGAQFTLLIIVLVALGVGITSVVKQNLPDNTDTSTAAPKPAPAKEIPPEVEPQPLTPEEQAKAKDLKISMHLLYGPESAQLAAAFTNSRSIERRLQMSRHSDIDRDRLSRYSEQALSDVPTSLSSIGIASSSGVLYERFKANFVDRSSRVLCVVATPKGLRVDWDGYARYGTASWPDIRTGTVKSATVRVLAKQSYHYKAPYQNQSQWLCCELTSPDFEGSLYAYALRGTTAAKLLADFLPIPESKSTEQVTLRISSSEGGHKRDQFTIDRVRAVSWVLGDKDVEESWVFER